MKSSNNDHGDRTELKKIPKGLDKSWESRKVEGLEMMISKIESQRSHSNNKMFHHNNMSTSFNYQHDHHPDYPPPHNHTTDSPVIKDHKYFSKFKQETSKSYSETTINAGNAVHSQPRSSNQKCRSLSCSNHNKISPKKNGMAKRSNFLDSFPGVGGSQSLSNKNNQSGQSTAEGLKIKHLESQLFDLIEQLALEKQHGRQDKLTMVKLQQQLARFKSEKPAREMLSRQLEEERRMRIMLEERLSSQCLCCQSEVQVLKKQNAKLNERIQDLLIYKNKYSQLVQTPLPPSSPNLNDINKLKTKFCGLEENNSKLLEEIKHLKSFFSQCRDCKDRVFLSEKTLKENVKQKEETEFEKKEKIMMEKIKKLTEKIKIIEKNKNSLIKTNYLKKNYYEKCFNDVTTQILQALVTQKNLKEENYLLKEKLLSVSDDKKESIEGEGGRGEDGRGGEGGGKEGEKKCLQVHPQRFSFPKPLVSMETGSDLAEKMSPVATEGGEGPAEEEDDLPHVSFPPSSSPSASSSFLSSSQSLNEILDSVNNNSIITDDNNNNIKLQDKNTLTTTTTTTIPSLTTTAAASANFKWKLMATEGVFDEGYLSNKNSEAFSEKIVR